MEKSKSYDQIINENPCEGCPAPCCRMLITHQQPPRTIRDIDHMRYSMLFENSEICIANTGEWSLIKWQNCTLLDLAASTCTVHKTPKQPLICKDFSPYQCWYKRNFVKGQPQTDLVRLNLERFETLVNATEFDSSGVISEFPDMNQFRQNLERVLIEPLFVISKKYTKAID